MKQIISIACLNLLLLTKAAKQYTATFTAANNKIDGTVTVDNGQVMINLDLSDTDLMAGDIPQATTDVSFADCVDGGLAYHIHQAWTYGASDTDDKFGGIACGATYTSGHWDPWNACGGASGNEYCGDVINATEGIYECIPTDTYTPGNYDANPFAAEVGDWSGKYAKIELDADNKLSRTDTSFYEVLPEEMAGYSVVFHCNSGARAFCAPFVMSDTAASATVPSQDGGEVAAYFTTLSDDSMIMLSPDGTITVNVDGTGVADITDACTEFEYGIFEAGSLSGAASGDDCSGVGAQYDPTNQCLPFGDSEYCTDGKLCTDPDYSYDCDVENNGRYSCAPGDLSGRAGELLTTTAVYSKTVSGPNTLIPLTDSLLQDKAIGIFCPASVSSDIEFLACAPILVIEDSSAATMCMVISFIMAFISVINM